MLRACWRSSGVASVATTVTAFRYCSLNMSKEQRDALTKNLTSVREEAKGQALDLADMCDASRNVSKHLLESMKVASIADDKFKGKTATLNASLKAYTTRLSNLQNEARAIQGEIDGLLKLLWGTEAPVVKQQPQQQQHAKPASPATEVPEAKKSSASSDFECDVPPIARRLEQINEMPPKEQSSVNKKVEIVEGEVIRESTKPAAQSSAAQSESATKTATADSDTIEIEVESMETDGGHIDSSAQAAASPADSMSITDITKDLYERGVNFSDCLDARSLRQRYRDVLDGRIATPKPQVKPQASTPQPPPPPRPQYYQQEQQQQQRYQPPPPNTTETGLASDPYPNAHRKMIDPMKYVWEVKQELAKEKNIDPNSVDLWSGKIRLEDHKRLYDFPTIQNYPIEVRQKGDVPR